MSQLSRIALAFVAVLGGFTFLHGNLNLRWFDDRPRSELTVAHLPVT
jgi:hypothetical protein